MSTQGALDTLQVLFCLFVISRQKEEIAKTQHPVIKQF